MKQQSDCQPSIAGVTLCPSQHGIGGHLRYVEVSSSLGSHQEDITRCFVTCLHHQLISLQVHREPATLLASLQNNRMAVSIEWYSACSRPMIQKINRVNIEYKPRHMDTWRLCGERHQGTAYDVRVPR